MNQQCLLMGVLNCTPDSFSDGGKCLDPVAAEIHAQSLIEAGADIIDIGAESTRPGAKTLLVEDEWKRLAPILERLLTWLPAEKISVDSRKPGIIGRVLDLNVGWLNIVGRFSDQHCIDKLASKPNSQVILTHMIAEPSVMQERPLGRNQVISTLEVFFDEEQKRLVSHGIESSRIWFDPGIGFGKTDAANWEILGQLSRLLSDRKMCLGVSRKSFLGRAFGTDLPTDRDPASKAIESMAMFAGVPMIRTHEIASLVRVRALLEN